MSAIYIWVYYRDNTVGGTGGRLVQPYDKNLFKTSFQVRLNKIYIGRGAGVINFFIYLWENCQTGETSGLNPKIYSTDYNCGLGGYP